MQARSSPSDTCAHTRARAHTHAEGDMQNLLSNTETHNGAVVPAAGSVLGLHNLPHDEACGAREHKRPRTGETGSGEEAPSVQTWGN
jgi:hypothetical protein